MQSLLFVCIYRQMSGSCNGRYSMYTSVGSLLSETVTGRLTLCDVGIGRGKTRRRSAKLHRLVEDESQIMLRPVSATSSSLLTSPADNFSSSSSVGLFLFSHQPEVFLPSALLTCFYLLHPIPLSTSSTPPYLTGCYSSSMCQRVNRVYL